MIDEEQQKELIKKFFKDIQSPFGTIQYWTVNTLCESLKDAFATKSDTYFLWAVNPEKTSRASDDDIVSKNYFALDFDIRTNINNLLWRVIDDWELDSYYSLIAYVLEQHPLFSEFAYAINSGNWFHFYYIWDHIQCSKEIWAEALNQYFKEVNELFRKEDDELFQWIFCDTAIKNMARIMRIPWTINYSRKKKFSLDEKPSYIVFEREIKSELLKNIPKIWIEAIENKKTADIEFKWNVEIKQEKNIVSDVNVYEMICQKDIIPFIEKHTGLKIKADQKNFTSTKDWSNVGFFVKDNTLYNVWSPHLPKEIRDLKGISTFTFIKHTYCNWNTADTFKWAKNTWSDIAHADKKVLQEQLSSTPVIEDFNDYIMSYDQLIKESIKYRRNITPDKFCRYWVSGLDKFLVGIQPDELVVIGAATWVGKSELCYTVAVENSLIGKKVLLLSLEWNIYEPALRHLQKEISKKIKIKTWEYRFNVKDIKDYEDKAAQDIHPNIKNNLFVYNKKAIPTIEFVKELVSKTKDKFDMYIIDHLHYIETKGDNENKVLSDIMRQIKTITDIVKKPIILASHLRKKQWWDRFEKDPTVDDLYGSSNIGKEATTIILITRCEMWDLDATVSNEYSDAERYSPIKIIVTKSRIWLPMLKIWWVFDRYNKKYCDNWCIMEWSVAKEKDIMSLTF